VKPAAFAYHAPPTLDAALALLAELGDEARVLAGGQSLVPMMNMRVARPAHLVDINGLGDLAHIRVEGDRLAIGALARHHEIEASEPVARHCPILVAAARNIGHYAIRQRGTFGGSLALADPAAEWPLMATLLDAEIEAAARGGRRRVLAAEFFAGVFTTALEPGEMVVAARLRVLSPGEGWGYRWLSRRAGDFALVHAAVTLGLDAGGRIARLSVAIGGVADTPLACAGPAAAEIGRGADAAWTRDFAARLAATFDPPDEPHAPAAYRRELAEVLLTRALGDALQCAGRTA
jgi:carbon-monoxide dehydrogenase medium subunit